MSILIVDDSVVIRNIVKQTLHLNGFKDVIEASDGCEGLQKFVEQSDKINMCILDVNMPKMDGIALTAIIRKKNAKIPIIVLSTETDVTKMMEAKKSGANGWVLKPFAAEKFIDVIKIMLHVN